MRSKVSYYLLLCDYSDTFYNNVFTNAFLFGVLGPVKAKESEALKMR